MMEVETEQWLPVVGFEQIYDVSDKGRVRSLDKFVKHWRGANRIARGRVLSPRRVRGYCHVTLQNDGFFSQKAVHRLVAAAFIANPQKKPYVNHIDGDKTNNAARNLEWVTGSENAVHAYATGLTPRQKGERCSSAVLCEADVLNIRSRLSAGETCVGIAADYPVTDRAISRIKRRIVWSHI